MPTIRHEFDERFRSVDWLRRNDRRRRMQRGARSGGPLGIFMIETVPMIMVRAGAGSNGGVRKARRSNAPPEDAQGGDTHDCGTVRRETAAAFPDKPDKRHVYPHNYKDDCTEVLVADRAFFGSRRLLDWVPRFSRWW